MKRWTLRTRLTLLYGVLFLVAGAVLLGVTSVLVQNSLAGQLEKQADTRIAAIRAAAAAAAPADGQPAEEQVTEIRRQQKELQATAARSVVTAGGVALLGVAVLAGVSGWLIAGRALRPVQRIRETARRISTATGAGRGLHERIALSGPDDEVKQLADTFDSMLEHLDRSFDGQRRFVANASHELRTPLALNRALVELAITDPAASPDARRLGTALLTVNQRHERLIEGLLMLADSENEVTDRVPVDLAEVAAQVALGDTPLEIRRDLRPAPTTGDPVLLERLAQNLVENATRHNVPGGWLSIATTRRGDRVVLTVSNTGEEIPAYEIESLFQPFRRRASVTADGDRGFGLGLSIVRAVARSHGGDAAARPRPGGGLTVEVSLPAAACGR
ncbi:histidine kinase [Kribbella flavida DSM 17836]|uniref:histidine kinase n=1 Tax=Kribbella flavida (strain DSM 17836 / JCM 10339 / NBRC 14399) TaxID=479435 RepID=D2PW06_KRIFD|nr:HAMP domain-containing sensor histidine kinase [Kribbella flavida]ADB29663.1 histidine kinase [Kribbella flavida DSM 17836]